MGLVLHILSSGAQPGRETVFPMSGEAMTLGRAPTNDVVLPDPTREISSNHAVIQYRAGDYVIVDTSTNGTFLNDDPEPLGDLPTPLNHGDILRIGAYELEVRIEAEARAGADDPFADLPPPLGEEPVLEDKGGKALDEIAGIDTEGGDFLDELLGSAPPNAARMPTPSTIDADDGTIDAFLDVEPDPDREGGASAPDHAAPIESAFVAGRPAAAIPDDWDEDLLAGIGGESAPPEPAPPAKGTGGGLIPETTFSDEPFEIPAPEPAKPSAPEAAAAPPAPEEDPIEALLASRGEAAAPAADPEPPAPAARSDPRPPAAEPVPRPAAAPPPTAEAAPASPASAAPAPAADAPTVNADLARRFLEAAGVDHGRIADDELGEIMDRAGTAFRILVAGAREVLMARTAIKDELRLDKTTISPDGNNPIKFSISAQQAVEAMIKPTVAGYQPGDRAAAEAMRDIRAHEMAMMSGMETAIKALLARFDPEKLAGRIEDSGLLGGLLRNRKAQYWDAFEKLYAQISEDAEEDFNRLFGKSFAEAYRRQLEKLKSEEKE